MVRMATALLAVLTVFTASGWAAAPSEQKDLLQTREAV
jgi:hypothetical protein